MTQQKDSSHRMFVRATLELLEEQTQNELVLAQLMPSLRVLAGGA